MSSPEPEDDNLLSMFEPPRWGTADAEVKISLLRAKSYERFPRYAVKPGVGHETA